MRKSKREQEIQKSISLGYTEQEAIELYEFDHSDAIESDANLKEFLVDELTSEYIEEKEIEEMFYKTPSKGKAKMSAADTKENTANSTKRNEERILALAEGLEVYKGLFPSELVVEGLGFSFVDEETGKSVSVKLAKHKAQKIVSKTIKRKDPLAPFSTSELRQMAIENVMMANEDLFEAPSFAGTQFGFATRDVKFPFGSIKLTNHKS